MAFVTLNGTTVRVMSSAAAEKYNEHGLDRERMFSGAMRMVRRGIYRQWDLTSFVADASTLIAILTSNTLPLLMQGDLCGADCAVMPILISNDPVQTAAGFRRRVVFTLHETPAALPPDTSAVPYFFWRGATDFWQDDDAATPALDGDDIAVWGDQSGNNRHGVMTDGLIFGDSPVLRPTRDGGDVRFGIGSSDTTALRFPDVHALTTGELMITLKALDDPPGTSDKLHRMASAGVALYPASTGHIHSFFGGSDLDAGDPTTDLTDWNVFGEYGSPSANAVLLNNEVLASGSGTANPFGTSADRPTLGGMFPNTGSGHFDGWVRHVVFFSAILTTSQRRSWYDFMRGAVDDPPIAP